jgi:hypothetical protein
LPPDRHFLRKAREFKTDNTRIGSAMPYSRQVWNHISPEELITFWLISHGCLETPARSELYIYWAKLKLLAFQEKPFIMTREGRIWPASALLKKILFSMKPAGGLRD